MKTYQHRIAVIAAAVWIIVLPFLWARLNASLAGCSYADTLPDYRPDFAIGAAALVLLPGAWLRKRWAAVGLLAAALLLPVLKLNLTGPMPGAWVISTLLLLLAAWGTRFAIEAPSPDIKRLALRVLLAPVYAFAAIGTPGAYLHFVAGVFAGLEGLATGKYFLGPLLCALSLFAMFAMWRLWSIGRRLWRHGAYTHTSRGDQTKDARGLLCAWIALFGFNVIAAPLYRWEEIVVFSAIFAPATILATVAFLWGRLRERTRQSSDSSDAAEIMPPRSEPLMIRPADLPGIACGSAIGLLGVFNLVPKVPSGWGGCDWTVFYPLSGSLWPLERPISFDGCADDAWTLTYICDVLSIICLIAGALAVAIGRDSSARRGTWTAAIVVGFVLTKLIAQIAPAHIAWLATLAVGASVVAGAAWLGHIGGRRMALWMTKPVRTG